MMAGRTLGQWLRAVRDCRIIRVGFDCDALVDAWELGLVDCAPVEGRDDALDVTITAAGLRAVNAQVQTS